MFASLFTALNALIYTLLAFIFPLYWSIKGLLRQYTVIIVPVESGSGVEGGSEVPRAHTGTGNVHFGNDDDSEVPSTFIKATTETDKLIKTTELGCEAINNSMNSIHNNKAPTSASASAWIHYWVLLASIHCITGLYERVLLPFVGNSFFYYCSKYISIYWLAKNDAQAAQTLWTALFAPFVSKHEQAVDEFVQIFIIQQARANFAKSLVALRKLKLFKFQNN